VLDRLDALGLTLPEAPKMPPGDRAIHRQRQ
jgi:hypothetical protein